MMTSTCTYIFKRGKQKDTQCSKRCTGHLCSSHAKNKVVTKMTIYDLPNQLHYVIVEKLVSTKNFAKLLSISIMSKYWHDLMVPIWQRLYAIIDKTDEEHNLMDHYKLTPLQRCSLLLACGCQKCDKKRVTKIHWPFPIRMCQDCFREMTISSYELKVEYNIVNLSNLNKLVVPMWSRHTSNYDLHFYIIKEIEKRIGHSLATHKSNQLAGLRKQLIDKLGMSVESIEAKSTTFRNELTVNKTFPGQVKKVVHEVYETDFYSACNTKFPQYNNQKNKLMTSSLIHKAYMSAMRGKGCDQLENINVEQVEREIRNAYIVTESQYRGYTLPADYTHITDAQFQIIFKRCDDIKKINSRIRGKENHIKMDVDDFALYPDENEWSMQLRLKFISIPVPTNICHVCKAVFQSQQAVMQHTFDKHKKQHQ